MNAMPYETMNKSVSYCHCQPIVEWKIIVSAGKIRPKKSQKGNYCFEPPMQNEGNLQETGTKAKVSRADFNH